MKATLIQQTGRRTVESKTICSLPFNSVSFDPVGNLRPCCNSDAGVFPENIKTHDIINNTSIQKLRTNLINEVKDSACSRCWKMEEIGNKSFRHIANEDANRGMQFLTNISPTVSIEDIRYLDISLGNKCNLACRMCHPGSSSLVAKQYMELKYIPQGNILIDFDQETKDKIFDLITNAVNLNSIYLLGGEPLINDFHDEILDLLIKLDRAKNITIHYNTNLHSDIEKYFDRWDHFKLIEMSVSVDGADDTYEYIRWPGSWNKVYRNIKTIFSRKHDNFVVGIAVTAQNLNVGNIPTLINKIHEIDKEITFYFIPVSGCNYLHLTPVGLLEKAIQELEGLYDPCNRIPELRNYYLEAIKLRSKDNHAEIKKFFDTQRGFDSLRKQNLFKTLPHFKNLAEEYKIEIW